jgi:antitoxin component YwqK of YwqJK toxin-antitoxin module
MALQVLYLNRLLSLVFIIFACSKQSKNSSIKLNEKIVFGEYMGGYYCVNKIPFTGCIFTLNEANNTDTLTIANYLNGLNHGIWTKFYSNGNKQEKREFNLGKKINAFSQWWDNGHKKLEYFFVNDEYEGICREWNSSGLLTKAMTYNNGHEDGSQKWWYDSGKIKANYIIHDGRRYGLLGTKNCINISDSIFKL